MLRPGASISPLYAALFALALGGFAQGALGARGDRDKPIHLEADRVTLDDGKQMGVFTGDVHMTQGTLSIDGDQIIVTQQHSGIAHGTATGSPAKFRQKRDGVDEYVEGSGQRIEYNAVSGLIDIYGQAHIMRGHDDVRADHITYNAHDQSFRISGTQTAPKKRVVVTISPKTPAPSSAVTPGDSLGIKRDTRMIDQDDKK
jgi:lipopolysaccharide export system protein LptA